MADKETPSAHSGDDAVQRGFEAYEATDYELAIEIWTPLADKGNAEAQVRLGELYYYELNDSYGPGYQDQAKHYLTKAADQDNAEGCLFLGHVYRSNAETPEDHRQAAGCYRKSAERGEAAANRWLARMLERGDLGEPDFDEILRLYRVAVDGGDLAANYYLAGYYLAGHGDDTEALRLLKEATEDNSVCSHVCKLLGELHEQGQACERDMAEAVRYYRMAGSFDAEVCFALARILKAGDGVPRDLGEAAYWLFETAWRDDEDAINQLRELAEGGEAEAQYRLACCYDKGIGVEKDEAEARKWFALAAEQGRVTPIEERLIHCLQKIPHPHFRHLRRHLDLYFVETAEDISVLLLVSVSASMTRAASKAFGIIKAKKEKPELSEDDRLRCLEQIYDTARALAEGGEISMTDLDGKTWTATTEPYGWADGSDPDPEAEVAFYTERAFGRDPVAQLALAMIHASEEDGARDIETAQSWIDRALEHPATRQRAMGLRARIYRFGDGRDAARAFLWQYAAFRYDWEAAVLIRGAGQHYLDLAALSDNDKTEAEWLLGKGEVEGFTTDDFRGLLGDEDLIREGEMTMNDFFQQFDHLFTEQEQEGDG